MQLKSDNSSAINRTYILADISEDEKNSAKKLAKSKGMTFQGWIGQLIRQALAESRKEKEERT